MGQCLSGRTPIDQILASKNCDAMGLNLHPECRRATAMMSETDQQEENICTVSPAAFKEASR